MDPENHVCSCNRNECDKGRDRSICGQVGTKCRLKSVRDAARWKYGQERLGYPARSGMVLKNAIGIAGAVVVLLAVLLPVTKIAVIYLTLRIVSAFVQPFGR